jgi:uncharacterized protein (TIGR00106 family)
MIVAFSVSPMGGNESVGASVAACVQIVRDSGLPHETNAMFTNIEGEWDQVMEVVRACIERASQDAPRVSVTMKIDHRPGVDDQLEQKVASVRRHLGEQ